jgi:hypothetical protein
MYHKSRYRANKKFYEKEENKEKKRIYMREYYKRPNIIQKRLSKRKRYQKDYHLQPRVIEAKKEYIKAYNARPDVKVKRHEWYLQKKIKDNDILNAINTERFIEDAKR